MSSIDIRQLEEIVARAVKRALAEARSEEMKAVAEALKALAEYVKTGFQVVNKGSTLMKRRWRVLQKRSPS